MCITNVLVLLYVVTRTRIFVCLGFYVAHLDFSNYGFMVLKIGRVLQR